MEISRGTVVPMHRIGVFGGSFDPPHIGHFICARTVAEVLGLTRVLVIPVARQPLKPYGPIAPASARWRMVRAITEGDDLFEPSRIEIDRPGASYTVDTLIELRRVHPPERDELFLIIGFDALKEMPDWKQPDRIFETARVAVMSRPGYDPPTMPSRWKSRLDFIETPQIDISSTRIRERIRTGLPVQLMVGCEVAQIIERLGLYR